MKVLSVACGVVVLLCLLSCPVIAYVGGRQCMPLVVPPFLPAQIVPFGIGFVAIMVLVSAVIPSRVDKRNRRWRLGTLAIAMAAIAAFISYGEHLPGFLHGLRDRFVAKVGYTTMREFAREVSQDDFPLVSDGVMRRPDRYGPASPRKQEQWDNLIERYRFLGWHRQSCAVFVDGGEAEVLWGSALTGHWGFQVSIDATLREPGDADGRVLRVAEDIQFIKYYH